MQSAVGARLTNGYTYERQSQQPAGRTTLALGGGRRDFLAGDPQASLYAVVLEI